MKYFYPVFLLGILLLWIHPPSFGQTRDSTVQFYLTKIKNRDSTLFYGEKLYDYTLDKPQFYEIHFINCALLYDISFEVFDSPDKKKYIQSIYNIINKEQVVLKSIDRLDGYRILGSHYNQLYDNDKSVYFFNQAINVEDTSCVAINPAYLSVLYTNLAILYLDLNELDKARLLLEKTIDIDVEGMGPVSEFLGIDYLYLAKTYQPIDPKKSLNYYLRAKRQYELVQMKGIKLIEIIDIKATYVYLAENYLTLNNPDQALLEIDTAINLYHDKIDMTPIIHGKALVTKATILYDKKDYQAALRQYHSADQFLSANRAKITYQPDLLLQMARCYLAMQQPDEAQKRLKLALTVIDQSGPPHQSRLDKIVFPKNLFDIYYEQAKVFRAQYNASHNIDFLIEAQSTYQRALDIFEVVKNAVSHQESRQVFMKNNAGFYEDAIDLNFEIWKQQADSTALHTILRLSEKSKNNFLYEKLNKANSISALNIPDTIMQKISELDKLTSKTEKILFQAQLAKNSSLIDRTRDNLISYRKTQKTQMSLIEKDYPQFYQLKYQVDIPSVNTLQQKLSPDEGMISYYVGTGHLYIMLIDRWDFSVERIPMDFSLAEKLDIFNHSIIASAGNDASAGQALKKYHETGFFLYQKLIAPFVRKLPERITILPDNVLENLAFDALLTDIPDPNIPYQDYPFLLKKYTINYQYTTDAICRSPRNSKTNLHALLAVAPSFTDDQSFSIAKLRDFGQLTHNAREVDLIKGIIGSGRILKEEEATEDNFMKLAPDYQIIHLATHGKVNIEYANYSYLAFQEIEDSLENELLYIKDIYGLQLNADLVVLSACETANGTLAKGEGIINLARGFTYAGAASVVPTLWKISDVATARLMEKFYQEIKSGQPKHLAMTRAKRHFLQHASSYSAHPFYWAAFVVIGDVRPIVLSESEHQEAQTASILWGTGTLILLILLGVMSYFRRRLLRVAGVK